MTNSIQPKTELWQNIFSTAITKAEKELGYAIPPSKLAIQPEHLREDERQAVQAFDEKIHELAIAEWTQQLENTRRILAMVIESQERRALAWLNLKSIDDVAKVGLQIADSMPNNSTKRQIQAFYRNHLPALDRAGVPMQDVNALMAETDSTIKTVSRAISRIEKQVLTEQEKDGKIRAVVQDALVLPAKDVSRKWINGNVHIPRDEYHSRRQDAKLITFIVSDDEQEHQLRKRTDEISDMYGNVLPVLEETQEERIKQSVLEQLTVILAIIQSGDIDSLSQRDKDIVNVLTEYGYVERDKNATD